MDEHELSGRTERREEGPSAEFIRAVAKLLEANPDDLLKEMGYDDGEDGRNEYAVINPAARVGSAVHYMRIW